MVKIYSKSIPPITIENSEQKIWDKQRKKKLINVKLNTDKVI